MKIKTFNYLWKIISFPFILLKRLSKKWETTIIILIILIVGVSAYDYRKNKEEEPISQQAVGSVDLIGNFQVFGENYDKSYIFIKNEEEGWSDFHLSLTAEKNHNGINVEIEKRFDNITDLNNYLISN